MRREKIVPVVLCTLGVSILLGCSASATAQGTFDDVAEDAWYSEAVQYVYDNGIMNGVGEERFAPNETVTRGMLVTILHRMEGEPAAAGSPSFEDVKAGSYYEKAVLWAAEKKIVTGYSDTSFGPNDSITREQVATILYRYTQYKGIAVEKKGDLSKYDDAKNISSYASDAMAWAEGQGLITGTGPSTLDPKGLTTRAQMATIIMRYASKENEDSSVPEGDQGEIVSKTYIVLFEDYDGSVLKREAVEAGNNATPPEVPVRTGYSFTGWSGSYSNITSDLVLVAQYEKKEASSGDTTLPPEEESVPSIIVSNASAHPGDRDAKIIVQVKNNPGILGMTLSLSYDESALKLLDGSNGEAFKDVLAMTKPGKLEPQCRFVWDGQEISEENIKDGEILILTFEVLDSASPGIYPIVCFSGQSNIVDNSLTPIDVMFQNGSIIVSE